MFLLCLFTSFCFGSQNISFSEEQIFLENKDSNLKKLQYTININPIKSTLYSSVFPGLGQLYNGKKIKSSIIFGIMGLGFGYTYYFENHYQNLKSSYIISLKNQSLYRDFNILNMMSKSFGRQQNIRKKSRDYSIAIITFLYVLNIIDAIVDANLLDFDIVKNFNFSSSQIKTFDLHSVLFPVIGIKLSF